MGRCKNLLIVGMNLGIFLLILFQVSAREFTDLNDEPQNGDVIPGRKDHVVVKSVGSKGQQEGSNSVQNNLINGMNRNLPNGDNGFDNWVGHSQEHRHEDEGHRNEHSQDRDVSGSGSSLAQNNNLNGINSQNNLPNHSAERRDSLPSGNNGFDKWVGHDENYRKQHFHHNHTPHSH